MQDLCNSIEEAIRAHVVAAGYAVSVFTGQGDYSKVSPRLVVSASRGEEFPLGSGNWNVQVNCELAWPAETEDLNGYRQLETDVLGLLMVDDLKDVLSAAVGLTVFGIHSRQAEPGSDGSMWTTTLSFTAYSCINDV